MNTMSDEGERSCPLCMEEMDLTDQQLKPCKCGYEICVWCWHHIMEMAEKDDTEGRCPACRTPYDKERIVGMTVNSERLAELNSEKKLKSQKAKSKTSEGRKHLSTVRVIQRNLVYIVGIPANLADEETLQVKEFFGQYGKILKVSITRTAGAAQHSSNNSCSVYITYSKNEEAIRCIQVVNGYVLDGKPLRACFGTTKYCHAWLRNMPCSNPDCLYLHDAGTQEDTFTKDDAISTCASKLQQFPGSALNNFHQRSGSVLPPPLDNFCGNNVTLNRPLVKPAVHNPVYSKNANALLNGDTGKSGGLPAAASWGLRVNPNNRPSVTNAAVIQGPDMHKPTLSSTLTSSTSPEVQIPTRTCVVDHQIERIVASGNNLPLSSGRLDTFPTSESCDKDRQANLIGLHVEASIEPTAMVKNGLCESHGSSTNSEMARRIISLPCSLYSDGFGQQVSDSTKLYMDVTRHSRVEEATQCSLLGPQSVNEDDSCLSESRNVESNSMISICHTDDVVRQLDHPVASLKDSLSIRLGALSVGPLPGVASTSCIPPSDEQSSIGLEMGVKMSAATNMDRKGATISPKKEQEKMSHRSSSRYGEMIENWNMDYGSQNPIASENDGNQASSVHAESNTDRGESSIITDILSLDISLDDHLASPQDLAKLLFCDNDKKTGYSKLFTPLKSLGNNESRFSFARMEDSIQNSDHAVSLNTSGTAENSVMHEIEGNNVLPKSYNGTSVHASENYQILDCHNQFVANEASDLSLLSRLEVTAHPRSAIQRKTLPAPPPGFYPQHSIDRDQYFSLLPSPGSTAQYQFLGSSVGLNSTKQIAGNGSYADVELIDPAIMAISRGKLPLSMTHMISPNYSSNLIGFSEMDQRLQLLKSRSGNLNHNSMMTVDQNKYNLLQDIALQEVMRSRNGSWGAWNMAPSSTIESGLLTRRGQSSLAEITNNGRGGYLDLQHGFLRSFPSPEDAKFQASNSSYFYNSAHDM